MVSSIVNQVPHVEEPPAQLRTVPELDTYSSISSLFGPTIKVVVPPAALPQGFLPLLVNLSLHYFRGYQQE